MPLKIPEFTLVKKAEWRVNWENDCTDGCVFYNIKLKENLNKKINMILLGRRLILFALLFLFAVQNGLGQKNSLYEQQDCINLINSINSRYNKSIKYNMETYANEVVVPCLVDNMINIMNRNNISLEDHKNRDIILEKSISCILSSFSSENKNPEESFNRKMYGALLSTIFSSIFNPDIRSSSSSSSQSN
jgi:hypothetical protein